ncbi:MAG: c-type cytochrome, partial [Pseudomonadota bacterium]
MDITVTSERRWLDITVGVLLSCLLLFGSLYIIRLNNDSRDQQLNNALAMRGQQVSTEQGCVACHTVDGSIGIGPSWKGMMGRTEVT